MAESTQLGIEPVDALSFALIPAAYNVATLAGEVGFAVHPCRMFTLQNFTDVQVMWSFDGINDHLPMLPNGYFTLDVAANQTLTQGLFLDQYKQIWCRYISGPPTKGAVYLSIFYAIDYAGD